MKRRRVRKQLRKYERRLAAAVELCLSSPLERLTGEWSEAALELLRAVNNVVCLSLMLERSWPHQERFLEYLDDESIALRRSEICVEGRFIWWDLRGKVAEPWWPDDRTPEVTKYGGKYMCEPFRATLRLSEGQRRRLRYSFSFGEGKTARRFRNVRPTEA
ncbi:MAG TPA: hypothetical protein VGB73_06315 [Pyrinomonadaceae bacterium]|jgi:hypothetical protein